MSRVLDFSDGFSSSAAPTSSSASIATTTAFIFANNQATADVTGALFDSTLYAAIQVTVSVRRRTTAHYRYAKVCIDLVYDAYNATWILADYTEKGTTDLSGEPSGITWSVTAGGQLRYATDSMTGATYVGLSQFSSSGIVI